MTVELFSNPHQMKNEEKIEKNLPVKSFFRWQRICRTTQTLCPVFELSNIFVCHHRTQFDIKNSMLKLAKRSDELLNKNELRFYEVRCENRLPLFESEMTVHFASVIQLFELTAFIL